MIDAGYLLKALRSRHADAVFVPECKDGATQTRAHRRLDAWVLLRTWSPITTIGYEIKVSRSDWLRDSKLATYQGLCHFLYLVAPKGLIGKDELPASVGLMEPIGDAGRLIVRKRADRRELDVPAPLLIYVLMSRATIDAPGGGMREPDDPHWRTRILRDWVAGRDERLALSFAVSKKIHDVFNTQHHRQAELEERMRGLERVEARMRELGFDPDRRSDQWACEQRLSRLAGVIPVDLDSHLDRSIRLLQASRERLAELKGAATMAHDSAEGAA